MFQASSVLVHRAFAARRLGPFTRSTSPWCWSGLISRTMFNFWNTKTCCPRRPMSLLKQEWVKHFISINNKCTCHMSIHCFLLNGKQIKLIRSKDIEVTYLIHTFRKWRYVLFNNSNICSDIHNCYQWKKYLELYIHIVINEMFTPACDFITQYYLTFGITNVKYTFLL